MKMHEVVNMVSDLYRKEMVELYSLLEECNSILDALSDALKTGGHDITYGDYANMTNRKNELQEEILTKKAYCQGICDAREVLLDLDLDTEVL